MVKYKLYFPNKDNRNTASQVLLVESGTVVKSNLEIATTLSIILKISESRWTSNTDENQM